MRTLLRVERKGNRCLHIILTKSFLTFHEVESVNVFRFPLFLDLYGKSDTSL